MRTAVKWGGGLVAVLAAAAVIAAPSGNATARADQGAVVRTASGPVRGTVETGYRVFDGIPYAAPPVGALRWRSPRPVTPWTQVRDATKPASPCPQPPNPEAPSGSTDEDCLYLNVTTPTTARGPLPVIVWIPGGGFYLGAGSSYGARRLATQGGVVVVTINYRLGIFGNFGLPGLPGSGTFGLQDQQAALRWVRGDIRAFGGDPHDVTVAGESAGAMSVCVQLTSPGAAGLFQKALLESGSCGVNWPANGQWPGEAADSIFVPRARVTSAGTATADRLGCPHQNPATALACLRALPSATVTEQTENFVQPAYDTPVLPSDPATALRNGRFRRMPVLSGTNHDENRPWLITFDNGAISADGYRRLVDGIAPDDPAAAGRILATYPATTDGSPTLAWGAVTTDRIWSCTQAGTDDDLARAVPVYAFDFDDPNSPIFGYQKSPYPMGAGHTAELPYLFELGGRRLPMTPAQQELSDRMIGYWANFARTGDPNGPGLPRWPSVGHSSSIRTTGLRLAPADGAGIGFENIAAEHHCGLWAGIR